jgi:Tol biopolymer transport system component
VVELYGVPITGGTPTKLSGTLVAGNNVEGGHQISPDNARVVFRVSENTNFVSELYSVPITGGTPARLSGTLVTGGTVINFQISPDSTRVAFRADKLADEVFELFRVQIGGQALTMDLDGDDRILPTTDLLMFSRYQLGLRGSALVSGALSSSATITSSTTIESRIRAALAAPGTP